MAKNGPEARSLAPRGSTLPCSSGPIELSLFDLPRPVYSAHSRTALISGLLEARQAASDPRYGFTIGSRTSKQHPSAGSDVTTWT